MTDKQTIEISLKGKWIRVPVRWVHGKALYVSGRLLTLAKVDNEEWLETELEDPASCARILNEQGVAGTRPDILTFAQKLPVTSPKYKYPMEWDSIAAIRINSFDSWWEGVPQETRKNVRRSQKRGVVVEVKKLDERLIADIIELNNDSSVRQGKAFTHFAKDVAQVTKDQQDFLDRSDYICAYADDELVGFIKLVYRGEIASILTFLPKTSQSDKRPANALMAKAVELCASKGLSYVTFGMFNYGNKRHTSLREFKIRNGFEEVLVPRYYIPLTWRGKIAITLKLHRGLIGVLPHSVITFLVSARAKLHGVKASRCSSTEERPNRNRQMERSKPPAGSTVQ